MVFDLRFLHLLFFGAAFAIHAPWLGKGKGGEGKAANSSTCKILSDVPVFVLNLDRRQDRLAKISRVFNTSGSPWLHERACRVSAPDGKEFAGQVAHPDLITPDAFKSALRNPRSVPLSTGPVASHLGHARLWEHVAQQSFPWAILLEDDISALHPDLDEFLCNLDEKMADTTWKVIQLQICGTKIWPKPLQVVKGHRWCGVGMYIISREAAIETLRRTFPIDKHFRQVDDPVAYDKAGWKNFDFHTLPPASQQLGRWADSDLNLDNVRSTQGLIRNCPALEPEKMVLPALLQPTFRP